MRYTIAVALIFISSMALAGVSDEALGLHSDGGPWRFYPAKEKGNLPRVLLIGDSIMNGYRGKVIGQLKGKASVDCWLTPLHLKSKDLHHDLRRVLAQGPYDVVHFNLGLHGWTPGRIPQGEYEPALRDFVDIIRGHSASARLIWSSTTHIRMKQVPVKLDPENNPTIIKRNAIAARVMADYNIPVNDLYGLLSDKPELARGDKFHWSPAGSAVMAKSIVSMIKIGLDNKPIEIYVSSQGKDSNYGTKDSPLRTLEAARDFLREVRTPNVPCPSFESDSDDIQKAVVYLQDGTYRRTNTFELDDRDSHTTYISRNGASVHIMGGLELSTSVVEPVKDRAILTRVIETAARPHLRQINLKELGLVDYGNVGPRGFRRSYIPSPTELFIDGKPMQLSRWPNQGNVRMGKVIQNSSKPREGDYGMKPGIIKWGHERPAKWTQAKDLYLSGVFRRAWADDTIPIAEIDAESETFTTALPHIYGFGNVAFARWYALNLLEEIDQPGEYFVDRETGTLYFYPPEDFSTESTIQVSELAKPLVAIEGAEGVRFEDLTFEVSRGTGVYIERGRNNDIVGCTFRNLGILGLQIGKGITRYPYGKHNGCGDVEGIDPKPISRAMGNWHDYIYKHTAFNREAGTGHRVVGCDIYDMGAGGISLSGGDRKTLTPGRNAVINCDIHRVNRWDRTYKTHVNVDGVGNIIRNCHLHDSESGAIYLHGNDHIMEFNEIDHVLTASSDMGAFYMGRDISEVGNVIRYNYFHDIKRVGAGAHVVAVYFDDGSILGAEVTGNVFQNVHAFLINGGGLVETRNNIFLDTHAKPYGSYANTGRVRGMFSGSYKDRVTTLVNISEPPYSTRYPKLLAFYKREIPVTYEQINNINLSSKDRDQFENFDASDLRLKPAAKSLSENPQFKQIPFEKIGLYLGDGRQTLAVDAPSIGPATTIALETVDVKISVPKDAVGAVYTLDGSEPNLNSTRYIGPIRLTSGTTVRAKSIGPGNSLSPTVSQQYSILSAERRFAWINFQPADTACPAGWLSDDGATFAKQSSSHYYGWTKDNSAAARLRGKNADMLKDTLVHFILDASWELTVPNGRYRVVVSVGDSEFGCPHAELSIEGNKVLNDDSHSGGEFLVVDQVVDVKDGRLTLSSHNRPERENSTRLNFVCVEKE